MKSTRVRSLVSVIASSILLAGVASAQEKMDANFGAYAGGSLPTGTFKDQANLGYHAGAYGMMRITPQFGVRLDGVYNYFGSKDVAITGANVKFKTSLAFATVNAQYDLGTEMVMAPGGGTLPYISGGAGAYRFSFDDACTGTGCADLIAGKTNETHWGLNAGGGAIFPMAYVTPFVDVRYHTIFPKSGQTGHANMLLASVGLKFR